MNTIEQVAGAPAAQKLLDEMPAQMPALIDLAIAIQQIPSPTFAEERRAAFVTERFEEMGLSHVEQDDQRNVFGCLPGVSQQRPIVISAHTDTVFAAETDLTIRRENGRVYGAGISDNSLGVAGLIYLGKLLQHAGIQPANDIWLAANSCEEGLGDLKGMRQVVARFGETAKYIVVEGGLYGQILCAAIGATRLELTVNAPGGHSWGDFGAESAIHVLGRIIADISRLDVTADPKTTFNVGVITGGVSVNSIAASATALIDLRSEDVDSLRKLEEQTLSIVNKHSEASTVDAQVQAVGNRPPGQIPRSAPLPQMAQQALGWVGCRQIKYESGSTDANIPLSLGLPAVCIGLTKSANAHRLNEYMETEFLPYGMRQLLLLALASSGGVLS